MNRTIIIGRVSREIELRFTQSGTPVCNFPVAVDKRKKDDGADFFEVVAWQKLGELCAQYLAKGRLCAVEGRMESRQYENKDGQKVRVWELVADNVQFLERANPTDAPTTNRSTDRSTDPFSDDGKPIDISDDDLPF